MNCVNYLGDRVIPHASNHPPRPARKRAAPDSFHKGFRVVGLWPGDFEKARAKRLREIQAAKRNGKSTPDDLTFETWAALARRKPLRAKPYELQDAAIECKRLTEKAGWVHVEIHEIKRDT